MPPGRAARYRADHAPAGNNPAPSALPPLPLPTAPPLSRLATAHARDLQPVRLARTHWAPARRGMLRPAGLDPQVNRESSVQLGGLGHMLRRVEAGIYDALRDLEQFGHQLLLTEPGAV